MATTTTLTLFLGFLALTSTLSFNAEARPQPTDEDLGTIIGPHTGYDDGLGTGFDEDLGIVIGPHFNEANQGNLDDEELGIVIGPHEKEDNKVNIDEEALGTIIGPEFEVHKDDFPEDFIFGTSVSAFQVEGAKKGSGRGLTTWDEFTHMYPDKVDRGGDADTAVDFYTRYKDDIKLMKELKTNGFRFSISWTRIMPYGRIKKDGTKEKGVNEEGVKFYNDLINALIENDIEPSVTLFHWESPLALEIEYEGFLSERIVDDFRKFAKFCFEKFGDRVKNWATFNEPSVYSVAGYSRGIKAPGRCSDWSFPKCPSGDSSRDPYKVAHNQILAHVAAVEEFRNCEKCAGGKIGIVLVSHWFEPQDPNLSKDVEAARRSLEYQLGWFLRPLTYGQYPKEMLEDPNLSNRLPTFSDEESKKLRNSSLDFVGLNYYGAFFSTPFASVNSSQVSYFSDMRVNWTIEQNHSPHLKATSMKIVIYPLGLMKLLKHIKDEYMDPEIYIMENGMDEIDYGTKTLEEAKNDYGRKEFIKSHILIMAKSIKMDKVKLKGYFIWSLMDNFEWEKGYKMRFGLYYVDYNTMERHIRSSGEWLRDFLDSKESLHKCYFEGHREKGYAPKLFDKEFLEPDNPSISYRSDFMS